MRTDEYGDVILPKRITTKWVATHSAEELYEAWNQSRYPFDIARGCYDCLTQHFNACKEHAALQEEIRKIMPKEFEFRDSTSKFAANYSGMDKSEFIPWLHSHFQELLALRRKYRKAYGVPPLKGSASREELA